ncbi:MAG TPA: ribonuclease PH [Caldilineaceae bacterium]|nr:ribonuclease PH [Caldilineaceae bacterium]
MSIRTRRAPDQLRPCAFELDYLLHPAGSVLISMGNTKVLCSASIDEMLPRWLHKSTARHGWVTAEYAMLPGSTTERTQRETTRPKGRTQEITRLIGRSLRSSVDLEKLGQRQIIVDCDVLQADGGTRTASVTGGFVALALAIHQLQKKGTVPPGTLKRAVAAVSVGLVDGKAILDLDYALDSNADVDLNVVMTSRGEFIEMQGTAEGNPFSRNALNGMLLLAETGINELLAKQQDALLSRGIVWPGVA